MVCREIAEDVTLLRSLIDHERWTPIVDSPVSMFEGAEVIYSDAVASLASGWGSRALGTWPGTFRQTRLRS